MLENIKMNEKYTLLIENTLGFIVSRQVKIIKAFKQQDKNCYNKESLIIHYVEKGKRKTVGYKYSQDQRLAIIEGYKDIRGTFQDNDINTFTSFQNAEFDGIINNRFIRG